jgi:pilus assembly protein CpaC
MGLNVFHKGSDGRAVGGMTGHGVNPGDFLNTIQNPSMPGTGPYGAYTNRLGVPNYPPDVHNPQFKDGFNLWLSAWAKGFPFSAMLSILESNGLAKVLAEPTLVTLSGQQARFLAGGEIPIPLTGGLGQIHVEWKKFGVILEFTPTVIAQDTIHLDLKAEVSEIDPTLSIVIAGTSIPGLTSRQSSTTVRLGDGQSFAIAGLLSDKTRSQIDKVPVLGSIPILGALFRSTQFQHSESELLVVVTAHLAQPVAPHQLPPMPTDREGNDPGDFALFLMGWDTGLRPGARASAPAEGGGGPVGARGFAR